MNRTVWLDVAHDLALAAWFGGAWMGAVGLNGATIEVDDHTQRTRVANAGWFRWAPIAGAALGTHVAASLARGQLSVGPVDGRIPTGLRHTRTAVTALAVAATAETGISGQRLVSAGDVPVATAVQPIAATPDRVARAQRRLRVAQWLVPALTGLLWVLEAVMDRAIRRA